SAFLVCVFSCGESRGSADPEPTEVEPTAELSGPPRPTSQTEAEPTEEDPTEASEPAEPPPEVAASESRSLIEPAIGQWARYGVTYRNGGRSFTRYSIVDREAGGFWVEVEDRRRAATRHVRMHLRPSSDGPTELLALMFKRDGEVEQIPPRLMPQFRPMLQQWIALLFPDSLEGELEEEAVSVPAGTFSGTRHTTEALGMPEQPMNAIVWRHPIVPISGMVKLSDESGEHTVQLLGYGLEGATSAFP
ncbi:MAG: hypothetical protein ACI9KE_006530, partial [Polyangiales bacterium]